MNLGKQKKLAARSLGVSTKRVKFNPKNAEETKSLKEMISREDAKSLLEEKIIVKVNKKGNSRTRANHTLEQKRKGRRSGHGSRKGTANARFNTKDKWMIKIRSLRRMLYDLREAERLDTAMFRDLYLKAKGNFFRNKRHLSLYIEQNKLLKEDGKK
jgi:large subunit ribosomal protein L19e